LAERETNLNQNNQQLFLLLRNHHRRRNRHRRRLFFRRGFSDSVIVLMDLYLLGWILSSILCLFALYSLIYDGKRDCDVTEKVNQRVDSVNSTDAGEIKSEKLNGDADVIIVGAGVAGAALAYTLGKVL
jgi:squalene monooxygenase